MRYIGKANNVDQRVSSHLRDSLTRRTPVYAWIRKLIGLGLRPDSLVLSESEDWQTEERRLIASGRRQGYRLLNVAEGGDEPHCPAETRARNGRKTGPANARRMQAHANTKLQQKINGAKLNENLESNPLAYAARDFRRQVGHTIKYMRDHGREDMAEKLSTALQRLRGMDADYIGYRLSLTPSRAHHFPEWCQELVRSGNDA